MTHRFIALLIGGVLLAASGRAQQPAAQDQIVNQAIARESALLQSLRSVTPVAETYIQELAPDNDFGTVPTTDHYFLGRIDLSRGITQTSYLRKSGDGKDPWTLMASYFPRTVNVILDGLESYKAILKRRRRKLDEVLRLAGQHSSADAQRMCDAVAAACVRAFDRVREIEPVMPRHLREEVYNWLSLMPGLRGKQKELRREFEHFLETKVERELL